MDDVLEKNLENHALPEQRKQSSDWRNIGIGIMGLADALIKLGLTYGSPDAVGFTNNLMKQLFRIAVYSSVSLAEERGNYPKYKPCVWDSEIMKNAFTEYELHELKKNNKLRNCSLLSVAPTGSIGTLLNVSTGCEPYFSLSYTRKTESLNGKESYYQVDSKIVEDYKKITGNDELPKYFITSQQIHWKDRINMQSALQEYCDTAISSTINLPNSTTVEDVKQLYIYGWEKNLKGLTIFRDGCKRTGILTTDKPEKKEELIQPEAVHDELDAILPKSRDTFGKILSGATYKYKTACGTLYITINKDENGNIIEIFTNSSKNGTCKANLNGETRLASLALRSGVKVNEVINSLKSIQCQSCIFAKAKGNEIDGSSCPDIISKCIKDEYEKKNITKNKTLVKNNVKNIVINYNTCPECGKQLQHIGGCVQCECGYSKCE